MTYPVYIGDRAAGTMTVTAAGEDHLAAGGHPVGRGGVLRREGLPMEARRAGGLPPAPAAGESVPPGGAAGAAGRAL